MTKKVQPDLFDQPTPKQMWLLEFKNPLYGRFGREFFTSIPEEPGVYRMLNDRREILYVGKAKNLRDRVRSYARVNAVNASRKVLRLVHFIRAIEWEILPDETAALLRENELLREISPAYNVVNTAPHTYLFVHLRLEKDGIRTHLAMSPDESYSDRFGAFKGLGMTYRMHKALHRLLWMSFQSCRFGFELPTLLTSRRKLDHHLCQIPEGGRELYGKLKRFFRGTSKTFLVEMAERILAREDLASFTRTFVQEDINTMLEFYEHSARRNRQIRKKFEIEDELIAQDEIDDLIVKLRRSP